MQGKNSLASSEERALIKGKASLLAAVDYYIAMQSDVFISASPGNMHNALVRSLINKWMSIEYYKLLTCYLVFTVGAPNIREFKDDKTEHAIDRATLPQ